MVVRVTKKFDFEMAHALDWHDGKCKNLHGHTYKLIISLKGNINQELNQTNNGMVIDFGAVKDLVKNLVVDRFDHCTMLYTKSPILEQISKLDYLKLEKVDFQPTAENLVVFIQAIIIDVLPSFVTLQKVVLFETETSSAEWHLGDN